MYSLWGVALRLRPLFPTLTRGRGIGKKLGWPLIEDQRVGFFLITGYFGTPGNFFATRRKVKFGPKATPPPRWHMFKFNKVACLTFAELIYKEGWHLRKKFFELCGERVGDSSCLPQGVVLSGDTYLTPWFTGQPSGGSYPLGNFDVLWGTLPPGNFLSFSLVVTVGMNYASLQTSFPSWGGGRVVELCLSVEQGRGMYPLGIFGVLLIVVDQGGGSYPHYKSWSWFQPRWGLEVPHGTCLESQLLGVGKLVPTHIRPLGYDANPRWGVWHLAVSLGVWCWPRWGTVTPRKFFETQTWGEVYLTISPGRWLTRVGLLPRPCHLDPTESFPSSKLVLTGQGAVLPQQWYHAALVLTRQGGWLDFAPRCTIRIK